jgi:hypothetical protein
VAVATAVHREILAHRARQFSRPPRPPVGAPALAGAPAISRSDPARCASTPVSLGGIAVGGSGLPKRRPIGRPLLPPARLRR